MCTNDPYLKLELEKKTHATACNLHRIRAQYRNKFNANYAHFLINIHAYVCGACSICDDGGGSYCDDNVFA